MKQSLIRYLPLLLLAAAWELAARLQLVSSTALPPLSDVIVAWFDLLKDGELSATAPPRSTAPAPASRSRSWSAPRSASSWPGGSR